MNEGTKRRRPRRKFTGELKAGAARQVLEEGKTVTEVAAISTSLDDELAVTCAEKSPPGPIEVRRAMGRQKPSDIINTTHAVPVLISDRVVGIVKAGRFSGWQTYPIDLFGKHGGRWPLPDVARHVFRPGDLGWLGSVHDLLGCRRQAVQALQQLRYLALEEASEKAPSGASRWKAAPASSGKTA